MPADRSIGLDSLSVDLTHFNLPKAGGVAVQDHPDAHKVFSWCGDGRLRDFSNPQHVAEDLELLKRGLLDKESYVSAYTKQHDPFRILQHDAEGVLKAVRYSHNVRINTGGKWLGKLMGGAADLGFAGTATAIAATSLTSGAVASVTANQYAGHWITAVTAGGLVVQAKIVSHTSGTTPVFTLDQWYLSGSATGAAGTTPTATTQYTVSPGQTPAQWVAFTSTASYAPNSDLGTVPWSSEITTAGLGRTFGTWSETTTPSAAGTTNQVEAYKLHLSNAVTGIVALTGAGMFDFAGASVGNPYYAGPISVITTASGDTIGLDWTLTNS